MNDVKYALQYNFHNLTPEYSEFATSKDACRQCSVYDHYSAAPVQSDGCVKNPTFMFIGEAPGADEVEKNRPFVGIAGERLKQELRKFPSIFNKQTTLISNLLSCRPMKNQFPTASAEPFTINGVTGYPGRMVVQHCCDTWLRREIDIVSPKIIVTVGSHSLTAIRNERTITQLHGTWTQLKDQNRWCYSLFHPSYVLRCSKNKEMQHVVTEFEADIKNLTETYEDHLD